MNKNLQRLDVDFYYFFLREAGSWLWLDGQDDILKMPISLYILL